MKPQPPSVLDFKGRIPPFWVLFELDELCAPDGLMKQVPNVAYFVRSTYTHLARLGDDVQGRADAETYNVKHQSLQALELRSVVVGTHCVLDTFAISSNQYLLGFSKSLSCLLCRTCTQGSIVDAEHHCTGLRGHIDRVVDDIQNLLVICWTVNDLDHGVHARHKYLPVLKDAPRGGMRVAAGVVRPRGGSLMMLHTEASIILTQILVLGGRACESHQGICDETLLVCRL